MKKRIIILALSTACACLGEAQENNIENRTVDLGTQTTTEFRKTQAVSTIYTNELEKNATPNPYNALYGLLPETCLLIHRLISAVFILVF